MEYETYLDWIRALELNADEVRYLFGLESETLDETPERFKPLEEYELIRL